MVLAFAAVLKIDKIAYCHGNKNRYVHFMSKRSWAPDHHTYMNLLGVPFQNHRHYMELAPFCDYNSLYSSGKAFCEIFGT